MCCEGRGGEVVLTNIYQFRPDSRGVANGIFSWGVYFGYGLAYIFGIYLTDLNVLGYGWRASYVIGGAPGIIVGILIFLTIRSDPGWIFSRHISV